MIYVEADILRRIVSYLRFHQNNPNSKAKLNSLPNNCRYINRDTIDALDIGGIHGEAELNEGEPYCRDIANISSKFFIALACLHIISFIPFPRSFSPVSHGAGEDIGIAFLGRVS